MTGKASYLEQAANDCNSLRQYLEEAGHRDGGDALGKLRAIEQAIAAINDTVKGLPHQWRDEARELFRHGAFQGHEALNGAAEEFENAFLTLGTTANVNG